MNESVKMLCDGCQYRGEPFEHLKDHEGIASWLNCLCPIPWWATPRAAPDVPAANHKCAAKKRRETEAP